MRRDVLRRGQVWSMDLIIAVIIFLLSIGALYLFTQHRMENNVAKLQIESQVIANKLVSDRDVMITEDGAINDTKLNKLANTEYHHLKEELGVHDDFCIILRDQNGNLIPVGNETTGPLVGVGSSDLNITVDGGTYKCNQALG